MARQRPLPWRSKFMIWLLFGAVLAFGLTLLVLAGRQVAWHLASQQWQAAPAQLLERGVDVDRAPASISRTGTTARLTARYAYDWQGQRFESDRLSFSLMRADPRADAIDDWNQRLGARLGHGSDVLQVWVNPQDPTQAVLLRDLRWFELGILLGFGLLLTWVGWLFLAGRDPHGDKPAFSWRTVGVMALLGLGLAVLAPLLWRDGHPVWAAASLLPLLLALYGTCYGLLARKSPP